MKCIIGILMSRYVLVLALLLTGISISQARTYDVNFGVRPTGAVAMKSVVVTGLNNQLAYSVKESQAQTAPFSLIGSGTGLKPLNGNLEIQIRFESRKRGDYKRTITLRSTINPTSSDSIVIVCTAYSIIIEPEPLEFGVVPTGDSITKFFALREGARDFGWRVLDAKSEVLKPFYVIDEVPVQGGPNEVGFNISFAPIEKGPYKKVLHFERTIKSNPTEILDTVRLELRGNGRSADVATGLQFPTTLTHDRSLKTIRVEKYSSRATKYIIASGLKPPFAVTSSISDFLENGKETIDVVFEPTVTGEYLDTLVLHRIRRLDSDKRVFDSILVAVTGTATSMKKAVAYDLGSFFVDSIVRQSLQIELPAVPQEHSFSYKFLPSSGKVACNNLLPIGNSKDAVLKFDATATSPIPFEGTDSVILCRVSDSGKPLDSTTVFFTMNIVERPLSLKARTDQQVYLANIGDTISVGIALDAEVLPQAAVIATPVCTLVYNPSVLVPIGESFSVSANDTAAVVTFSNATVPQVQFGTQGQIVAMQKFVVALGDADSTVIDLQSCTINSNNVLNQRAECTGGVARIGNVFVYQDGRKRLVNSLAESLVLEVDPNPVTTSSKLIIANHSAANSTLHIVNNAGFVVADLTSNVRSGQVEFNVGRSAPIQLSPGSYTARLTVQTQSGKTLTSIVRLFVVQ